MEVSRIRSILVTRQNNFKKKETLQVIAAFCPFVRTSPIHFALLGRKRKYIKSETTAKLIEKRTSIAAVPDKLGQNDTFLTPLLSGCRLPLKLGGKVGQRNRFLISNFTKILILGLSGSGFTFIQKVCIHFRIIQQNYVFRI